MAIEITPTPGGVKVKTDSHYGDDFPEQPADYLEKCIVEFAGDDARL